MTETLVTLIVAILRAFIPALVDAAEPEAEEGMVDTTTRDRLRERIRATWGVK